MKIALDGKRLLDGGQHVFSVLFEPADIEQARSMLAGDQNCLNVWPPGMDHEPKRRLKRNHGLLETTPTPKARPKRRKKK